MALAGSGEISIAGSTSGRSVALEFGRGATSTLSLSQLYRGGGIVPNTTANNNIPTSGAISLSNFYNAVNRVTASVTYNSSQANVNFTSSNVPGYVSGATDVTVYINSPVSISAASGSSAAAFTVGAFASGDTINIVNAGSILGRGGKGGGEFGTVGNYFYSSDGGAGGNAIDLSPTSASVTINNSGIIAGGGGGGGNGQASYVNYTSGYTTATHYFRAGGGGGGAGTAIGNGGNYVGESSGGSTTYYATAANGADGTFTAAGAGGTGNYGHWSGVSPNYYGRGGTGGTGGARGASGTAGGRATYSGQDIGGPFNIPDPGPGPMWITTGGVFKQFSAGGAAGNAIKGTGKLASPVTNSGTIYGPQVA